MKPAEFVLGKRPDHAHGDAGCFKVCPVWEYDLTALKIEFELVTVRMDELKRSRVPVYGPSRMVTLTRRLYALDDKIKAMQ